MFDMTSIGKKISIARKSKNMTQIELSDKLNVSFQAVSNWERGISMPDISKLPDITALLDLSIDELLGKDSNIINSTIPNKCTKCSKNENVTNKEMINDINILNSNQENGTSFKKINMLNICEIEKILPFLGKDICNNIFMNYMNNNDFEQAEIIAPFVSVEVINNIVIQKINEGFKVGHLIGFMNCDTRDSMILKIYESKGIEVLGDYLPFASKSIINKIALIEYKKNQLLYFEFIAPFIERKLLNKMVEDIIKKHGIGAISHIAQFIDKDILKDFVSKNYF